MLQHFHLKESRGLEVARCLKGMTMGVQLGVLSHPLQPSGKL